MEGKVVLVDGDLEGLAAVVVVGATVDAASVAVVAGDVEGVPLAVDASAAMVVDLGVPSAYKKQSDHCGTDFVDTPTHPTPGTFQVCSSHPSCSRFWSSRHC